MRNLSFYFLAMATPLVALAFGILASTGDEWEKNTVLYEDDAWYDVSEWLDGNDYNPTDETIGEWDDEIYNWDSNDSDVDDDVYGYGYDEYDTSDDWYYDYYDNNDYQDYYALNGEGIYEHFYDYQDYDNDGTYDAYSTYYDSDNDGTYDRFEYYRFSTFDSGQDSPTNQNGSPESSQDRDKAKQEAGKRQQASSKQFQVSGEVQKTKKMQVRNGPQRMIAQVSGEQDNNYIVDLGRADQFSQQDQEQNQQQTSKKLKVKEGDRISASGPMMKVGDKQVLLAQSVKIGSEQEHSINRSSRTVSGKVSKTKNTKVRGHEVQMVILDLDSGKQALIDLGKTDELDEKVAEGDQLQVTGIPVKVKDRSVILAKSFTKNGEKTKIERTAMRMKSKSGS